MDLSRYIVSDDGHIYDMVKQRFIKEFKSNNYVQCQVYDDEGEIHICGVHQIVARLRCSDWFEGCVVHHKDGNTRNNSPSNLECLSRSDHSRNHIVLSNRSDALAQYTKKYGPHNKNQKMSREFCINCSISAQKRGFNGNQYVDKNKNRR